ncbi:MAG TPA: hypothetical protein VIO61_07510 [Anaerolineaceae bacterium]
MEAAGNLPNTLAAQDTRSTPASKIVLAIPESAAARVRKHAEPLKDKEIRQTLYLGFGLIALILLAALLCVVFVTSYAPETFLIPALMLIALIGTGILFFSVTTRMSPEKTSSPSAPQK